MSSSLQSTLPPIIIIIPTSARLPHLLPDSTSPSPSEHWSMKNVVACGLAVVVKNIGSFQVYEGSGRVEQKGCEPRASGCLWNTNPLRVIQAFR